MASLMERPLSVKFSLYNFRGINHHDVLNTLQTCIETENIKSIQMKEKECIITVANMDVKNKILVNTFDMQNRSVSFQDVDSLITNITVKDAPYEMSDSVITNHLSKYGEVVSGSVTRGKIRRTDIDNGTRYVKILNCVPVLPLRDQIGRFPIRLFADNNRTPCRHCNDTSHPCFKCPQKESNIRSIKCWRCGGNHHKKDCQGKKLCHFCTEDNHLFNNCPHRLYGEYANDILEGQATEESEAADSDSDWGENTNMESSEVTEAQTNAATSTAAGEQVPESEQDPDPEITPAQRLPASGNTNDVSDESESSLRTLLATNKLIIGDSNGCRLKTNDKDIHNLSKSGAKFMDVEKITQECNITNVDSIVVHLGTNNLKTMDHKSVTENAINSLKSVETKWPNADIAFSSILPRMGKSRHAKEYNSNAKRVNSAVLQFCVTTQKFHYLDNDDIFCDKTGLVKDLYDGEDPSGIHISKEGATALYKNFTAFLLGGISDETEMDTTRNKRLRSDGSASSQELRASKQSRNQSNTTHKKQC